MRVGDIIPAFVQLPDYNNGKFPSMVIRDASGAQITGSPLHLGLVSNGYYANNSLLFPDTEFLTLQSLVYDDSGRTILSTSEGGGIAVIFQDGSPGATQVVPMACQLASYLTNKFVRAVIRDDTGSQVSGSPVNLTHIANGLYASSVIQMSGSSAWVTVQYLVYDDSGYTTLSASQGGGFSDAFLQPAPSSSIPANTGLVGILDSLLVNPINGIQDQLVTNTDRILNARIVRSDNGDPFDLTGATDVKFRFLNADETILVVAMTDPGAPVQVTRAAAGMVSCSLTKAQTALLKPMSPAPFSVVMILPGGQTIANFPYQLEISAEINP